MHLASFLSARYIILEKRDLSPVQVYENMIERILHNHTLPINKTEILELVLKREKQAPTALPSGLAIPHIRLKGFEDIVLVMCFLQHPLNIGGTEVSWLTLIITDEKSSNLYLNMVSTLLKLSGNSEAMRSLHEAQDPNALFNQLQRLDLDIHQELYVSDIMSCQPYEIHPEATMRELIAEMDSHQVAGLPVVNETGKYLGEVNILDILKVGVPDYVMMIEDLKFLHSFEPLEKLFERQDDVRVKDIMRKDETYLHPAASVVEAVFIMMQERKRYISVVDNGLLKGVITAMDIFRKIIS